MWRNFCLILYNVYLNAGEKRDERGGKEWKVIDLTFLYFIFLKLTRFIWLNFSCCPDLANTLPLVHADAIESNKTVVVFMLDNTSETIANFIEAHLLNNKIWDKTLYSQKKLYFCTVYPCDWLSRHDKTKSNYNYPDGCHNHPFPLLHQQTE